MKNINKEQFLKYKKSETLIIWGAGSSIKNLKEDDFNFLNSFDSIGITMFCKTNCFTVCQTYCFAIWKVTFQIYKRI